MSRENYNEEYPPISSIYHVHDEILDEILGSSPRGSYPDYPGPIQDRDLMCYSCYGRGRGGCRCSPSEGFEGSEDGEDTDDGEDIDSGEDTDGGEGENINGDVVGEGGEVAVVAEELVGEVRAVVGVVEGVVQEVGAGDVEGVVADAVEPAVVGEVAMEEGDVVLDEGVAGVGIAEGHVVVGGEDNGVEILEADYLGGVQPQEREDNGVEQALGGVENLEMGNQLLHGAAALPLVNEVVVDGEVRHQFHVTLDQLAREDYAAASHHKITRIEAWIVEKRGGPVPFDDPCPYSSDQLRNVILDEVDVWIERREMLYREQTDMRRLNCNIQYEDVHLLNGEFAINRGLRNTYIILGRLDYVYKALLEVMRRERVDEEGRIIMP